jgi:hypothetical protein
VRLALPAAPPALDAAIGVLALGGFAVSVIDGMLYKIVPFLAWFHLQAAIGPKRAPHVKKLLPDAAQRLHFAVHAAAVALLLAALAWPESFVYPAALTLAVSAVALLRNLVIAARRYRYDARKGCQLPNRTPGFPRATH